MTYNDLNAFYAHHSELKATLTPSALAVAAYLAIKALPSGEWFHSHKNISQETGLGLRATNAATKKLVESEIVYRWRDRKDKPYVYVWLLSCGLGCTEPSHQTPGRDMQKLHNPNGEPVATPMQNTPNPISENRITPISENRITPSAESAEHIKEDKELNKELKKEVSAATLFVCKKCDGTGSDNTPGVIHKSYCQDLDRLKRSEAWNITASKNPGWNDLDAESQQLIHLEEMKQMNQRKAGEQTKLNAEAENKRQRFAKEIANALQDNNLPRFLPNIHKWLEKRFDISNRLASSELGQAVKYTRKGTDLPDTGKWQTGEWICKESFTDPGKEETK